MAAAADLDSLTDGLGALTRRAPWRGRALRPAGVLGLGGFPDDVRQEFEVVGPLLGGVFRQADHVQPRGATSLAACFSHRS